MRRSQNITAKFILFGAIALACAIGFQNCGVSFNNGNGYQGLKSIVDLDPPIGIQPIAQPVLFGYLSVCTDGNPSEYILSEGNDRWRLIRSNCLEVQGSPSYIDPVRITVSDPAMRIALIDGRIYADREYDAFCAVIAGDKSIDHNESLLRLSSLTDGLAGHVTYKNSETGQFVSHYEISMNRNGSELTSNLSNGNSVSVSGFLKAPALVSVRLAIHGSSPVQYFERTKVQSSCFAKPGFK